MDAVQVSPKKVNSDHYWFSLPNEVIIGTVVHTFQHGWFWLLIWPQHISGLEKTRKGAADKMLAAFQEIS